MRAVSLEQRREGERQNRDLLSFASLSAVNHACPPLPRLHSYLPLISHAVIYRAAVVGHMLLIPLGGASADCCLCQSTGIGCHIQ